MNEKQLLNQQAIDLDTFFGDTNHITLQSYEKRVAEYEQSVQIQLPALKRWIDFSLDTLPKNSRILEIGSATPRDALYMRSKGYQVVCSDAPEGFVQLLKEKGENALKLNILTDSIPKGYDMIFANAVFPHMTEIEMKYIINKVHHILEPKAIFAFSVKQGEGETWITEKFSDKRFIKYWQPEAITKLLKKNGFEILFIDTNINGDLPTHKWINITARNL